jgi:hypothetical protein
VIMQSKYVIFVLISTSDNNHDSKGKYATWEEQMEATGHDPEATLQRGKTYDSSVVVADVVQE